MSKYRVTLGYYVSQIIEVEAESVDQAIEEAYDQGVDMPNISNKFEEDGDVICFAVYDDQGNQVFEGDI